MCFRPLPTERTPRGEAWTCGWKVLFEVWGAECWSGRHAEEFCGRALFRPRIVKGTELLGCLRCDQRVSGAQRLDFGEQSSSFSASEPRLHPLVPGVAAYCRRQPGEACPKHCCQEASSLCPRTRSGCLSVHLLVSTGAHLYLRCASASSWPCNATSRYCNGSYCSISWQTPWPVNRLREPSLLLDS